MWCAEVPTEEKIALLFAGNMEEIGITVNIVKTPWLSMAERMSTQDTTPNMVLSWSPYATYPEAGSMLESAFHSSGAGTVLSGNWLLNATIDDMIEDSIQSTDKVVRFQKYGKLQEIINDMCIQIQIGDHPHLNAYQAYYVDWPAANGWVYPHFAYNLEFRYIQVYPDKKAEL
jgi:peptide/nickel transport system substrate-binding protein